MQFLKYPSSIGQKIGSGYALTLSVAILGTALGLGVGNYYQQKARTEMLQAETTVQQLSQLQIAILQARSHQQEMLSLLRQPKELEAEYSQLLQEAGTIKTLLSQLQLASQSDPAQTLAPLLPVYASTLEEYVSSLKKLLEEVKVLAAFADRDLTQLRSAQELIQNFLSSTVALKFEYLSYRLTDFLTLAYQQEEVVEQALDRAEQLRNQIMIASMFLSGVVAILLAIYTSRSLSQPIQTVTCLAQRVTQEENFTLTVPVTTEDEVGLLALSLNQLIQWIQGYTQQLEEARKTLEQRVIERTDELFQKNQELEKTSQELAQALDNLKETQTQLIQTEKMSSLGQMVAGIAHEINNPVNFIYGNLILAEETLTNLLNLLVLYQEKAPHPSSEIQDRIEELDLEFLKEDLPKTFASIKQGAERIRNLVLSLRNFSRLDESELKEIDIHEGIKSTLLILSHRLKAGVEVIEDYEDLPLVECYPAQLNQVFMNIINNAIDALFEKADRSKKQILIQTKMLNYQQVQVKIKDNGPGIDAQVQQKIFEPFFTTKPIGKGTGLGLSICYQIIQKHQGEIIPMSQDKSGTEFKIILPLKISSLSKLS